MKINLQASLKRLNPETHLAKGLPWEPFLIELIGLNLPFGTAKTSSKLA